MTSSQIFYIALVVTAFGVAVGIYSMLRRSLRETLGNLVRLAGVSTFYERVLLVGLVLTCVGWALDASFGPDAESSFMDHLWDYADGLGDVLVYAALFSGAFAVLITVLISSLGRHHDG